MEFIQEGKSLIHESYGGNKAGAEHIAPVEVNDVQTRTQTMSIEKNTKQEEWRGTDRESNGKLCEDEKDDEMLKGNLDHAGKPVFTTDNCDIAKLEESKNGEGECDLDRTIDRLVEPKYCSSMNVAEKQTEKEEPVGNGGRATPKRGTLPEREVRRVLNYIDKDSGCVENKCSCTKDGYLERVMSCPAFGRIVNRLSVLNITEAQDSRALDKIALICPQPEVVELKSGVSIEGREVEFWKPLPTTHSSQITDMALFLDNFKVTSPKLGRDTTDIAAKGLSWLKSSSPANLDRMPDLESINAQLHRRVRDLESELDEAKFRQGMAESAYQQTVLQMEQLWNKLDNSSDRISELETTVEEKCEVNSQLQHTERQVIELRVSLRKTEEENGELERKLLEAQKHVQRLGVQVQIGVKQRQQLVYELEEERELSSTLQQEVVSLQKALLSCRKALDFYKDEVSSKEALEEELRTSNAKLKRTSKNQDEEVSTLQNELRQKERNQLELQEDLWQTQRFLDEVKSEYQLISEEKNALIEELQAYYERHQELKMTYSLCVHERNEKEQEIAVLVAKVEKSQSEAPSNIRCCQLNKRDENEDQNLNRHERTMIEGEDLHPLPENAETIKISLACVSSPYIKDDGTDTEVYFYDLQEAEATDPMGRDTSNEESLHDLERDDKGAVVTTEQLLEIESLFRQCKERQNVLENNLESSKVKINSLQQELINSHKERLDAYSKISQLQMKHGLKTTLEKCKQEKGDLLKRVSELSRKVCDLKKKYESEKTERRSLQQQLRSKEQENDGDRSEIRRMNQRCMEQNLLLDASEFGMSFF